MLSSRPAPLDGDAHLYPSKTPARARGRAENAVPVTLHKARLKDGAVQTPFQPGKQPLRNVSDTSKNPGKPVDVRLQARPFGDKTPFPNRLPSERFETPAQPQGKLPKLSFFDTQTLVQPDQTPGSVLASSTRRSVRAPRSSVNNFVTPENNRNHWDISETDIVAPHIEEVREKIEEDDYDEIEYMAPNTLDLPYQPPFDFEIPDYKKLGKALWDSAHSYPYDDTPVAEIEIHPDEIKVDWDLISLPELESDDPFEEARRELDQTAPSALARPAITKTGVSLKTAKPSGPSQKPLPVTRPKIIARSASTSTVRADKTAPPRPSTSQSTVRPTESTLKKTTTKAASTSGASATTRRGTETVKPATTRIIPKPASSTLHTIPPRPATAASLRSRMTGTTVPGSLQKRPASSTSSYKHPTTVRVPPSGPISHRTGSGTIARTKPEPSKKDSMFLVEPDMDIGEDFMFDV